MNNPKGPQLATISKRIDVPISLRHIVAAGIRRFTVGQNSVDRQRRTWRERKYQTMYYAALVLRKATTEDASHPPLYEETVVLTEAGSEGEARTKAEAISTARLGKYKNPLGETVTWTLERIVDVSPVIDPLGDGAEIYSRHFRNFDDYVRFEILMQKPTSKR